MSKALARRVERMEARLPPPDPEVARLEAESGLRRALIRSRLVDQLEQIAEAEQGEMGSLEWLKHQVASLALEARLRGDRDGAFKALSFLVQLGGYSGPAGEQKPDSAAFLALLARLDAEEAATRDRLAKACPP